MKNVTLQLMDMDESLSLMGVRASGAGDMVDIYWCDG